MCRPRNRHVIYTLKKYFMYTYREVVCTEHNIMAYFHSEGKGVAVESDLGRSLATGSSNQLSWQ